MTKRKYGVISISLLILASLNPISLLRAQVSKEIELKSHKRIDKPAREEVSGIVKDPRFDNVYWIHGDSGTKNRIYAINEDGEVLPNEDNKGFKLNNFENIDWEDITIDGNGNIIVGDIGNNCHCRKDLSIIQIPSFNLDGEIEKAEKFRVFYEKPDSFLYKFLNYSMDAEALFTVKDELFIITKKYNGKDSNVFKLSEKASDKENELKQVTTVDFDDEVTGADYAYDKLAVLTYKSLWIFEQNKTPDFFDGKVYRFTFEADQVESVAFMSSDMVLIAEENGDLYKVTIGN